MDLQEYFDDFTRRDWQEREKGGPVRIATVGCGWFTRNWALPGIERTGFCEPAVAVDVDPEAAEATAAAHGMTALTPEAFTQGDAADAYDAVYVCTPNATHLEYVEAAARQGKDVLCEKPMEATVERARRLVETCEDAGVALMVGYRMQTEPAVRRAKELYEAGFIGDALQVHGQMTQTMLGEISGETDQWRLDPELSGGCALMDLGVYPVNTTRFILGMDPTEAFGRTASEHEPFADVDERASFHLQFPEDVTAVCTVSQHAQHASQLRITGTEGQLTVEPAFYEREDRGLTVTRGGVETEIDFEGIHQLEEEFAYFGHCLVTGTDPHPDGRHALVDMETIDAIYESADSGDPVAVGG